MQDAHFNLLEIVLWNPNAVKITDVVKLHDPFISCIVHTLPGLQTYFVLAFDIYNLSSESLGKVTVISL